MLKALGLLQGLKVLLLPDFLRFFVMSRRFECDFIAVCDRDGNRDPSVWLYYFIATGIVTQI